MNSNHPVTIYTFTYPHELMVVKGKLISENIECFVMDELTAQVNPIYSNAIGGIKLQVMPEDVEKAMEILREAGLPVRKDISEFAYQDATDRTKTDLPLVKNLNTEHKNILIISFILILIFTILLFITLPT
ncbi:MAG: DUF2007 domain-containing protein [Flavobacteriales bacterium]|nr:DUF2007 domain-containing protein [Flavobacteriales bacterium]